MADEAFDVHGKHHFHYEPGLVESVREHVLKCQAGLQEVQPGDARARRAAPRGAPGRPQAAGGAALAAPRSAQRRRRRRALLDVPSSTCAADLERALIMIERYALPLDVCADSLFKAGQIKGDAAKSDNARAFRRARGAARLPNNELSRRESVEQAPAADHVAVSAAGAAPRRRRRVRRRRRGTRTKAYAEYATRRTGCPARRSRGGSTSSRRSPARWRSCAASPTRSSPSSRRG